MESWYRILRPPLLRPKKVSMTLFLLPTSQPSSSIKKSKQLSPSCNHTWYSKRPYRYHPSQTHPKAKEYLVWIAQRNIMSSLVTVAVVVKITPRPSLWHIQQPVSARTTRTVPWF
jgi:hypothetical protein